MPSLRLATFNCENLLMRCDFSAAGVEGARRKLSAVSDPLDAERVDAVFNVLSEDDRTLTAQALTQTKADVCALQEVENLVTLTAFDTRYMARWAGRAYGTRVLHEGNDGRGIDVGLLSRIPVSRQVSHAARTFASLGVAPPKGVPETARAFRRDCLEVDVVKDGRALTLFVCHFKSMHGGRGRTREVRLSEARAVRALVGERFGDPASAEWVILGDLNDYVEKDGVPVSDSGLDPLLADGFAVDLAAHCVPDPFERWSHHYAKDDTYAALDHILLSPRLAERNERARPVFVRAGLAWRVARHKGFRLPGVGWSGPKASDHCPLVATLAFEGAPAGL